MSEVHDSTASAEEVWMAIPGLEGWYSVSSLGRIKSEPRLMRTAGATSGTYLSPGRVLAPWLRGDYLQFTPSCPAAKVGSLKVHRMVALAFLGPCPPGMEVNHRDGVKTNNRLDNLEYVTRGENIRHAMRTGLKAMPIGARNPRAVLCEADVLAIRAAWPGRSLQQLADQYGVTKGQIAHIVHRRTWTHVK